MGEKGIAWLLGRDRLGGLACGRHGRQVVAGEIGMGILKIKRDCPHCGEQMELRVTVMPCPEIKEHEKIKRIRQD